MSNELISLDDRQLKQIDILADDLSKALQAVPQHLQGKVADCKAVVRNSIRWHMDPYLVAQETSNIKGKLMYSGKLVNAVVGEDPRLEFPLDFEFEGEGEKLVCTVIGKLKGEGKERRVRVPIPPSNKRVSDHWKTNPEQQISYYSARVWARRHLPGKLLGVWTPDDPRASHGGQPEPNTILDGVVKTVNKTDDVEAEGDVIDGEYEHVDDTEDEGGNSESVSATAPLVTPAIVRTDGTLMDFNTFEEWRDFIHENLLKIKTEERLNKFVDNHKNLFKEYIEAGHEEDVTYVNNIIMETRERVKGADDAAV